MKSYIQYITTNSALNDILCTYPMQSGGSFMNTEDKIIRMTDIIAAFVNFTSKKLPDDIYAKLEELRASETQPMARAMYDTMLRNLELALELGRPMCQDTGIMQFWVKCGSAFPLLGDVEKILTDAVLKATESAPLRPNAVETFEERNTGTNTGTGVPTIWWDIVSGWDGCEIYTYHAGGGSSLPGQATVLMPSQGYEAIPRYVLDRLTEYGPNACPPLIVGIGLGNSVETAALNSKKALMRPVGSHNPDAKAAAMERMLEDSINAIGFAPHGIGGDHSVYGVNIENTCRHPASFAVAMNVGCWCHRRGHIVFSSDLSYKVTSHSGFTF